MFLINKQLIGTVCVSDAKNTSTSITGKIHLFTELIPCDSSKSEANVCTTQFTLLTSLSLLAELRLNSECRGRAESRRTPAKQAQFTRAG